MEFEDNLSFFPQEVEKKFEQISKVMPKMLVYHIACFIIHKNFHFSQNAFLALTGDFLKALEGCVNIVSENNIKIINIRLKKLRNIKSIKKHSSCHVSTNSSSERNSFERFHSNIDDADETSFL
jgi:hypothetical protein